MTDFKNGDIVKLKTGNDRWIVHSIFDSSLTVHLQTNTNISNVFLKKDIELIERKIQKLYAWVAPTGGSLILSQISDKKEFSYINKDLIRVPKFDVEVEIK